MQTAAAPHSRNDETVIETHQQSWIPWVLGVALLGGVVVTALDRSEASAFTQLFDQASPWWLVLALVLQGGTYLAQAEVFRLAPHASGARLPRAFLYQLSLAKLFFDQALQAPSPCVYACARPTPSSIAVSGASAI